MTQSRYGQLPEKHTPNMWWETGESMEKYIFSTNIYPFIGENDLRTKRLEIIYGVTHSIDMSYHEPFYFSPLSLGGGWKLCLRPSWNVWVWGSNPWTRWDLGHIVGGEGGSQHILKVATLNSLLNASQGLTTIVPIMLSKLLSLMPFHHILNRCYITYYHFIISLNVLRGSNL